MLTERVVKRLEHLAQAQNTNINELVERLLDTYEHEHAHPTLGEMAQNALDANLATATPVDTAKRSRDILRSEYADYLSE